MGIFPKAKPSLLKTIVENEILLPDLQVYVDNYKSKVNTFHDYNKNTYQVEVKRIEKILAEMCKGIDGLKAYTSEIPYPADETYTYYDDYTNLSIKENSYNNVHTLFGISHKGSCLFDADSSRCDFHMTQMYENEGKKFHLLYEKIMNVESLYIFINFHHKFNKPRVELMKEIYKAHKEIVYYFSRVYSNFVAELLESKTVDKLRFSNMMVSDFRRVEDGYEFYGQFAGLSYEDVPKKDDKFFWTTYKENKNYLWFSHVEEIQFIHRMMKIKMFNQAK